ncbi:YgiW/YdeI family stress tolerance OB fold protein [Vibrio genomosp. F10]|uniref:Uncharacterized protein n=2 Tax=Vibrio genomosp. F10 TaxID=723171 RepID=A0A1E5BBA4_9VIBR|nr:NirD/YgiW/YdeI family stress tolerance protein [Vibrio genomosp. F10]OEE31394.1 hypothetical protein A1QO_13825 [Vibrio genomosp. F10 str. ZF-129]OEE95106.1 hypothetical protein A1QM_05465 [Vibrio genomosp. F10 str. 9ZC157]OEF10556.1 hypothetical protein A1QI_00195 [Vibrio genomosp. F10 str. 9ZB36]
MNKHLMVGTIAGTLALTSLPSFAHSKEKGPIHYSGPVEITTIKAINANTKTFSDNDVIVEGTLTKQLAADQFMFNDGTGEILIDLDDINIQSPIDQTTRVRLFGEYEGGAKPEIEVDHLILL